MDPGTIALTAMAAQAGGAAIKGLGAFMQGQTQADMYQYQAATARINAQIAKQNANWELQAGDAKAQARGMKGRQEVGEEKAIQGASGLDVSRGSAAAVRSGQTEVIQHDEATITANAAHRAYGFETQAAGYEAEANLDEYAASRSKDSGILGALSSIIGGAAGVSDKWMQYKQYFGDSGGDGGSVDDSGAF